MPWIRRRRYDRYDPYYYDRGRYQQSSCLRDACLLETGCCVAESLDGNCLMLALPLLPSLFATTVASFRSTTAKRPASGLLAAIRFYQREISAQRPACCRFTPSCSQYAVEAIDSHGAIRGSLLAARRLLRCRPGGNRGSDPVPSLSVV